MGVPFHLAHKHGQGGGSKWWLRSTLLKFCLEAQDASSHHQTETPAGLRREPQNSAPCNWRAKPCDLPVQWSKITKRNGTHSINSLLMTLPARSELILKSCFYMLLGKEYSGNLGTSLFLSLGSPPVVSLTWRLTSCGCKIAFSSSWAFCLHVQQKQESLFFFF